MTDRRTLVIIGSGLAGAEAGFAARTAGHEGRIVLVGDEPHAPYERPPLSKAVLRGEADPSSTRAHRDDEYEAAGIELVTGREVVALDTDRRVVHLEDDSVQFTEAVIATGARPRRLTVPGAELAGVHHLRTIEDARRLRGDIRAAGRVAVIGAGWIGSEVAASARQMGADVVMVDPLPTPLHRVLGDRLGELFRQLHADHGVYLRLRTGVAELRGDGRVEAVVLTDGTVERADVVVVGIGVVPGDGVASSAGLVVDDGIVVDEQLRTSVAGIYAAGDVAAAWHPRFAARLRVEHWANALHQGRIAGCNAAGAGEPYERLPYFFSDQYDLGLEYVGHHDPTDELVIRGDLASREFIAFWTRRGVVTAAMAVNTWDVIEDLTAIVLAEPAPDARLLRDPAVPLGDLVPPAGAAPEAARTPGATAAPAMTAAVVAGTPRS